MRALQLALLLLLLGCGPRPAGPEFRVEAVPNPLDVVLLLDQSTSMQWTDPENNRTEASRFFVEYLGSYWAAEQNHRVGLVNFGSRKPLNPEDESHAPVSLDTAGPSGRAELLAKLKPLDLQYTSFIEAFRKARQLFDEAPGEDERQRVIILLTDGEPDDPRKLPREAYFRELVGYFDDSLPGCHLHVIGIDEQDRYWSRTLPYWRRIAGYTERISSAGERELKETFWRVVSREFEGAADRWEPIPEGGLSVELPPYLEAVSFTVHKELPDAEVVITDPAGTVLTEKARGTRRALKTAKTEVWRVEEPEAGTWSCRVEKGGGRVEVGTVRIPAQPRLVRPEPAQPLGKPFVIMASFLRKDGRPVEELRGYRLAMSASVALPGDPVPRHFDLEETSRPGMFQARETIVPSVPGEYRIGLSMKAQRLVAETIIPVRVTSMPYLVVSRPRPGEVQPWRSPLVVEAEVRVDGRQVDPAALFTDNINTIVSYQLLKGNELLESGHLQALGGESDVRFAARGPRIEKNGVYRLVTTLNAHRPEGSVYEYSTAADPVVLARRKDLLDFASYNFYVLLAVVLLGVLAWDWQRIGRRTGWWGWRVGGPKLYGQLAIVGGDGEPEVMVLAGRWRRLGKEGPMLVARRRRVAEPDETESDRTVLYLDTRGGSEELDEHRTFETAGGRTLRWSP